MFIAPGTHSLKQGYFNQFKLINQRVEPARFAEIKGIDVLVSRVLTRLKSPMSAQGPVMLAAMLANSSRKAGLSTWSGGIYICESDFRSIRQEGEAGCESIGTISRALQGTSRRIPCSENAPRRAIRRANCMR